MRHSPVQRFISLLLLAGVMLSLLPFGRDAVVRERWLDWVHSIAPEPHQDALWSAVSEMISARPGHAAMVQALVVHVDADPAWFGLDAFSDEDVRRIEQEMAAVPTGDPYQPLWVQAQAAPPSVSVPSLSAAVRGATAVLAVSVARKLSATPPLAAPIAGLVRTLLSPRAP